MLAEIETTRSTSNPVDPWPELTCYCYRFKALNSVVDTEVSQNPFVNGYFRTTPIAMQGVSTVKIEWTDGAVYPVNTTINGLPVAGQTAWYGYEKTYVQTHSNSNVTPPGTITVGGTQYSAEMYQGGPNGTQLPAALSNDAYDVVFNYANKEYWPKAIRLTYHMADATGRLKGGRDFVQVIHVPD